MSILILIGGALSLAVLVGFAFLGVVQSVTQFIASPILAKQPDLPHAEDQGKGP